MSLKKMSCEELLDWITNHCKKELDDVHKKPSQSQNSSPNSNTNVLESSYIKDWVEYFSKWN